MSSIVCTLFEGHYHYGVAALTNSLYKQGFKGDIYAGYKGKLPMWATTAKDNTTLGCNGAKTLCIERVVNLHFIPLDTDYHLTNYKPAFMIDLWNGPAKNADNMFYFDPDIINKCSWQFYEEWVKHGIAIVHETIWNDMPSTHPKRMQWKQIAESAGYKVQNQLTSYLNAGFLGVHKNQIGFLELWKKLIDYSILNFNLNKAAFFQSNNNWDVLRVADQDLLNLSAMCTNERLSEFGPEGMDFIGGGWLMSHATGSPKPWNKNFFLLSIMGNGPSITDKLFWKNCSYPINLYGKYNLSRKKTALLVSSFISRFYKRS